jgi:hypothetical protein
MRKSSSLARIKDLADEISRMIASTQSEYDQLVRDVARLKEIEPALAKLQAALRPETFETVAVKPQPGDLCNTCEHKSDKAFACTHDATQYCANYPESLPGPNIKPVKRARRIKKILSEPDSTPPA